VTGASLFPQEMLLLQYIKQQNMSQIKAILLDFDGTLANTTDVIIQTMFATIKELQLPERSYEECASTIGLRLPEVPKALFPDIDMNPGDYETTYRRLFNIYNTEDAVKIYPNVMETLAELKSRGFLLTIASSRSHRTLDDFVRNLNLTNTISYVLGAEDVTEGKPNPQPVNMTLEKFNISPKEALVVGDTVFDIEMGRNAGTKTCGVTFGNGSRESMANADWLIDDFADLLKIVEQY
jgi:HAD superfamily hydrolase (TIGR01662 family)